MFFTRLKAALVILDDDDGDDDDDDDDDGFQRVFSFRYDMPRACCCYFYSPRS